MTSKHTTNSKLKYQPHEKSTNQRYHDTTTEERIEIVKTFLSSGSSDCEGIDMDDLYYDYIFGLKELADINREFSEKHAGSIRADNQNRL